MEPRHQVTRAGVELIKRFEGYRRAAARLPDGRYTLGYGHTVSAREGAQVSEADAEALLRYDLRRVVAAVNEHVYTPLSRNQFDALVAFAFSVGLETFRRSNVLRRVNEGDLLAAATALEGWRRAEFEGEAIVIDALIRRRSAEKALFLTPDAGYIAVPSAVLRPELDFGVLAVQTPILAAEIVTPLDGEATAPERLDVPEPAATPLAPSPAMIAAENVSRRLQALFPDTPEPEPVRAEERLPELAADPALTLAAFPEADREPELQPELEVLEPVVVAQTSAAAPVMGGDPVLEAANDGAPESFDDRIGPPAAVPTPASAETRWPNLILGLLGLALFALSVGIVLNARRMGETGLIGVQSGFGWILGLIAIAAICTAVYNLFGALGQDPRRKD